MTAEFSQFLADRNIDCQSMTPELRSALLAQFEAEQPPSDRLVSTADCPAKTHRVTQMTFFDCSQQYL